MKVKPWKLLNSEEIFKKFGRGISKCLFELPNGKQEEFYIKSERQTVDVLALTSDKQVILLEQFRPGPNKILYTLPGGFVQSDQPLNDIQGELKDETGYEGDFEFVSSFWADGYSTMYRHCFVAQNCARTSGPNLEQNEFINIKLVDLKIFRSILQQGQMTDIESAYLGLDYLGLL